MEVNRGSTSNDVYQASTKHVDQHDDPLMYDGPMTRVHMKKFKDTLGVFLKKIINLGMENQSTKVNGVQLSEFGESLIQGQNHYFYTLLSYFDPQNEEFM